MNQTTGLIGHVDAAINFLEPGSDTPRGYMYEPPPGVPVRTGRYGERVVRTRGGRPLAAGLGPDRQGFRLLQAPSAFADFYGEPDGIRAGYYPEVARIVREATGAARVEVFDHNVRNGARASMADGGVREPVRRAHNDYTERSGPQRVRDLFGDAADDLLGRRFAFINLWRPIAGPVLDTPLALCDAASMSADQFVVSQLIYRDRVGETYAVLPADGQRWLYFPQMTPDEALLIKCYDSATDGRARFTAHTAFDDPTAPADAPPRESIEARTIAFFD